MKLQNTFVQSKLNQDIDERLLPKGQYPYALNIKVANSEGSDVGAIENTKGNEVLTSLSVTNGVTIGAYSDGSNQKIYWFVTGDDKDLVVEYDTVLSTTTVLLESSKPSSLLNFNSNYLITGIVKIINGDSNRDLLIWTDDLNPPRVINIERAKTYIVDGFTEQDISLTVRAPRYAPDISLTYTEATAENNLENKFLSFGYRYRHLDGGVSPISSFTNYAFAPSGFDLDFQTMENRGMSNSFNAVNISFNTGSSRVTDVELVYKESGSNTIYLIESFNKSDEGWSDDTTESFVFSNSKSLIALPEDELFRTFDNIPRTAKALELIGTRIAFGNYLEQYDLDDILGDPVVMDYSLEISSSDLTGSSLPVVIDTITSTDDGLTIDLTGMPLERGNRLTISTPLTEDTYEGSFEDTFSFIFNEDYADATALAADADFIYFVETLMTSGFNAGYGITPPDYSILEEIQGFEINASTATTIQIKAPVVVFRVDDTPSDELDNPTNTHLEYANFYFESDATVSYKEIAIDSSLKSNRSYEVGIIYMDADGRTTPVITDGVNTIYVDQILSTSQNKINVTVNHKPPYWADRYKIVVKQNKGNYQTIYTNLFYEDGLFRWVRLEGANVNKVKEGDTLIVKSDLGGAVGDLVKTRVLEISNQDADFIEGNEDEDGNEILEESGLYMKIKPSGFDMSFDSSTIRTYEGSSHLRYPTRTYTTPVLGTYDDMGVFVPYALNVGSRVRLYIKFKARGSIAYEAIYDKSFRVNGSYASMKDWFEAEVVDLGSFGENYTRGLDGGYKDPAADGVYDYSYGFSKTGQDGYTQDGERFYAWAHRDGTASRNITTNITIEVLSSDGIVIFETEPEDKGSEFFYETAQTFDIVGDVHEGNTQNQSLTSLTSGVLEIGKRYTITQFNAGDDFTNVGADSNESGVSFTATGTTPTTWTNNSILNVPAVIELDFFNCYVQGNGAESYRYLDAFNVGTSDDGEQLLANYLNIDLRPSTTTSEKYREVRRFSDITYGEPYNENTNLNGLGVFNLAKANYKEDIDKKYGFIQKLYSRDTNLVVFQEDKVSYVLYGKDVLTNADGTSNVTSIEDVLGQQVMYTGEYGISRDPESFAFDANNLYFKDSKRGCVCRLGAQGITEISMAGMRTFFKDIFKDNIDSIKVACYDPYLDQYVVNIGSSTLTFDEKVKGWTSFHSYIPEYMVGMNNKFYSFKGGQLYEHHSDSVPSNNFYEEQFTSKVGAIFNDSPSDVKEVQHIELEGNDSWEAALSAFVSNSNDTTDSTVTSTEFVKKEGKWYGYARRNESNSSFDSKATYGLGTISDLTATTFVLNGGSTSLCIGDTIVKGSNSLQIGTITDIDDNLITMDTTVGLTDSDFVVGMKDARIEGGNLRGYVIRVDLENASTGRVELYAVNLGVMKSFS